MIAYADTDQTCGNNYGISNVWELEKKRKMFKKRGGDGEFLKLQISELNID